MKSMVKRRWFFGVLLGLGLLAGAGLSAETVGRARPGEGLPRGCERSTFRIALDVGHDLTHPGATSARGRTEFSYNLALGELVLSALRGAGFSSAFLIGQSGAPMALTRRSEIAREAQAGLFISLHHDSAQKQYFSTWQFEGRGLPYSDVFSGYSIFVSSSSRWAPESLRLATGLGQALQRQGLRPSLHHAEPIPGEGRKLLDRGLGIYEFGDLAVLRGATMPALLLESGVIANREEERAILSGGYHPRIVAALLGAVGGYCQGLR